MKKIEVEFLLPNFKSKLAYVNELLEKMDSICDAEMNNRTLGSIIKSVFIREGAQAANPIVNQSEEEAANTYFSQVKNVITEDYLAKGQALLEKAEGIKTLKEFNSWLNEYNMLVNTIKAMGERPFTFKLNTFHTIHNVQTGEFAGGKPEEFDFIILPFKTTLAQMVSVCDSAIKSIDAYVKSRLEWKREEREISNKKFGMGLQVLTIVMTATLSFFFLTGSEPLKIFMLEKKIKSLIKNESDSVREIERLNKKYQKLLEIKDKKVK